MAQIYDNWEKLVTAVLRREWDKQLALCHSRDPSSTSSISSSFDLSLTSTPQLDDDHHQSLVVQERSQLPMDYSELTLYHRQWKAMLPPDKREVVWRSASRSFFLDKRTGKNCFLVGAANLIISTGEPFQHSWESESDPKSRFSEVAKFKDPSYVYVKGSIKTKMLSPKTSCAAYFVFGFTDKYEKQLALDSSIKISHGESDNDCSELQVRTVNLEPGKDRVDGWKEIQVGDFYIGESDNDCSELQVRTVIVKLLDLTSSYSLRGLIMEGIEFRPLKGKRNTRGKRILLNLQMANIISSHLPSPFDH